MQSILRAGTVQFQHRANDKAYNLSRVYHFTAVAKARGVKILAFPEMCLTGYWHVINLDRKELEALAEPVEGGPHQSAMATTRLNQHLTL